MRVEMRMDPKDAAAMRMALGGFARLGYHVRSRARRDGRWLAVNVPDTHEDLDSALTVLQGISELQLTRAKLAGYRPELYASGIRYQREPIGREWWQTALDNFKEREGDCEDLANHRAAELVVYDGEPAKAVTLRTGPHTFHAVVQRADGSIEDPSAALGMLRRRRRRRF